jgi:hypothetical protein
VRACSGCDARDLAVDAWEGGGESVSPRISSVVARGGEATNAVGRGGMVVVLTCAPTRASCCARETQRKVGNGSASGL